MMASDSYHDELNGWLTVHYDPERAARDCNAPVMVSTTSVTSLQGRSVENMSMNNDERTTEDLCQDCWQDRYPDDYFPMANRYATCDVCEFDTAVIRTPKVSE